MDSIIAPAVIASLISGIIITFKEMLFERQKSERKTKILALKLHYILTKYSLGTAIQLQNTKAFIINKEWYEGNGWCSQIGSYNTKLVDLPLDIETIDWENMRTEVISLITKLALDIQVYRVYISDIAEVSDSDDVENAYLEKSSGLGLDTLKIIRLLSYKYDIPYTEIKLNDDTLQDFFTENLEL